MEGLHCTYAAASSSKLESSTSSSVSSAAAAAIATGWAGCWAAAASDSDAACMTGRQVAHQRQRSLTSPNSRSLAQRHCGTALRKGLCHRDLRLAEGTSEGGVAGVGRRRIMATALVKWLVCSTQVRSDARWRGERRRFCRICHLTSRR